MKTDLHSINTDQKLYVLTCGGGYSCLGWDVCQKRSERLANELQIGFHQFPIGSDKHYEYYLGILEMARQKHALTGWRSLSELNPKLIGLEGKRIEAIVYGEKVRFNVGKSTGFTPCHLRIHNSRSHGGESLPSEPEKITILQIIK